MKINHHYLNFFWRNIGILSLQWRICSNLNRFFLLLWNTKYIEITGFSPMRFYRIKNFLLYWKWQKHDFEKWLDSVVKKTKIEILCNNFQTPGRCYLEKWFNMAIMWGNKIKEILPWFICWSRQILQKITDWNLQWHFPWILIII